MEFYDIAQWRRQESYPCPKTLITQASTRIDSRLSFTYHFAIGIFFYKRMIYLPFIYLLVFASFSNTPHVIFQDAAFYQIGQACFFHDTLSQPPYLYYPIDISPLFSPTFLVFNENLFDKYIMPNFTEVNLISVLLTLRISKCIALAHHTIEANSG